MDEAFWNSKDLHRQTIKRLVRVSLQYQVTPIQAEIDLLEASLNSFTHAHDKLEKRIAEMVV